MSQATADAEIARPAPPALPWTVRIQLFMLVGAYDIALRPSQEWRLVLCERRRRSIPRLSYASLLPPPPVGPSVSRVLPIPLLESFPPTPQPSARA
jgi:hypothetical protein